MKVMQVKEFTAPTGQEYIFTAYPGPGVFRHASGQLYLAAGNCVVVLTYAGGLVEEIEITPPAPVVTGISEDTLLKAIALSQMPTLAPALLGGTKE